MIVSSVTLEMGKLTRLSAELEQRAETVLEMAATEIQRAATDNTVRVETTAMKTGWRVIQEERLQRTIFNTQDYAIYHELGTVKMSASPMLTPAVEQYRQNLTDSWKVMFDL